MHKPLDGQVAIVTGASSGIGQATARALSAAGACTILVARRSDELALTEKHILESTGRGDAALAIPADVRQEEQVVQMVERVVSKYGRIDILVTAAGIGKAPNTPGLFGKPVHQLKVEEWDAVIDTNLRGAFLAIRAVLPQMIAQRHGQVINISSARGGTRGQAFTAPYSASKSGLIGLTEAVAEEVREWGIRVQVLLPDVTDTPMLHTTTVSSNLGPLLSPERVAACILQMIVLPDDATLPRPVLMPVPVAPAVSRQ